MPVLCHSPIRACVHTNGFGRTTGGNSTHFAAFTTTNPSGIAAFSAVRNVSRIRCRDVGPTGRCHFTVSRRAGSLLALDATISVLCSTIASNMSATCATRSLPSRTEPMYGIR
ncbi:hypothetical protein LWC34_30505 [Kibdelosporangium philippinense]|uniref:Uncharacterized protein n=1 Tax=Kibdelosporangium philippinense TaxID=211113 RepID=A0ABS8ZH23_9PSEU|nr:hypothetical protein [Kibdelosporangium philippinense]MCE7007126.1 hypothetical protein [Kibdelosporangium philippinense]